MRVEDFSSGFLFYFFSVGFYSVAKAKEDNADGGIEGGESGRGCKTVLFAAK